MSINEIESKVRELRQLQALIEEATTEHCDADTYIKLFGDVAE